jgi:membrane-bound ClpP family serine protease
MAVEAVSKSLGIDPNAVQDTINNGKLTADQIASIQSAEIALKAKAQEMSLDFEQLAVQDRKSAREMQITTKSWIPPLLAILVTLGFFGILASMMTGKVTSSEALMIMLGSLGTAWTGIIAFYFGSSASSQNKDTLLHQSTPTK